MTDKRIKLVKHYIRHAGLGLPQAVEKVKAMTDKEVQEKLEKIAEHTYY